ncbi:MAG TPA: ABC transporter permease [Streptosporangiaceae bacterium]|nr:ABC transporter permease [Streptosporangiaceae bacterium]
MSAPPREPKGAAPPGLTSEQRAQRAKERGGKVASYGARRRAGLAGGAKERGGKAASSGARRRAELTLHAEWTKLRTSPGTVWLLAGVVVATVAVSAAATAATRCPAGTPCPVDVPKLSLTGVQFSQAVVAVLGVLMISGEYSTGMIRTTFAAMPRRSSVLAAKAVVLTGLVLPTAAVAVAGCLLVGRLTLPAHGFTAARGFPVLSLADGPVLRAAAGSVLYLVLIALLSLGAAAVFRDSATAVGVVLGLLFLFPIIAALAPNPHWQRHLDQVGPMTAGLAIQATTGLRGLPISPWAGLGVLAAWAAGALLAGGLLLQGRDA